MLLFAPISLCCLISTTRSTTSHRAVRPARRISRPAPTPCTKPGHFFFEDFFLSRLLPSAASRLAVRCSAAAKAAFLARATRSSFVMFLAAFLPPSLPNLRAISFIATRISAVIFMQSIVLLRKYGTGDEKTSVFTCTLRG